MESVAIAQPNVGTLARHSELWFDDGNVVLAAENTLFKVHRTILAHHAEVFKDMFTFPQPPQTEETYDGCPITAAPHWHLVRAITLLETKYQASRLRAEGLHQLELFYPRDVVTMDTLEPGRNCMQLGSLDPLDIANVLRTLGMVDHHLHLRALYDCCQLMPEDLLNPVDRLHREDLSRCVYTLPLLAQRRTELVEARFRQRCELCQAPEACLPVLEELRGSYDNFRGEAQDPLRTPTPRDNEDEGQRGRGCAVLV
ncbi:hypothetical protein EIP91_001302 [Steccherinum ochraceum]|uniref:BTB domain-containing protein n=1 Tax=Steccherinum ochraceum TaxID=92696 RepID=A0A4R0RGT3_9APHY|nr:hypothetical protein EIP91_001302 [Steccherinum ochraceum]